MRKYSISPRSTWKNNLETGSEAQRLENPAEGKAERLGTFLPWWKRSVFLRRQLVGTSNLFDFQEKTTLHCGMLETAGVKIRVNPKTSALQQRRIGVQEYVLGRE